MKLVLDAHIVIWLTLDSPLLSANVREVLFHQTESIGCSVAQLWEIEIKIAARRMPGIISFTDEIHRLGLELIPIEPADAVRAAHLPRHHGDPFDRMLIAQAQARDLTIITHDQFFASYAVPLLLA